MRQDKDVFRRELNQAIDYDKVLLQFAQRASFDLSKQNIIQALPNLSLYEIQTQLALVKEAIQLFRQGSTLSMLGISDISDAVKKADKGMTLYPMELYEIAMFCGACQRVNKTLRDLEYEKLKEYAMSMEVHRSLISSILDCIDASGSVKDDASSVLVSLNAKLLTSRNTLNIQAKRMIAKHKNQLMETMTVMVQGRVCLLVKASDKNVFGGMIHGSSQSGLAYYVEPSSLVDLNNQVQLCMHEIEEEKARICKGLSEMVAKKERELLANLQTMTILDETFAKARWAIDMDGCVGIVSRKDRSIWIEEARHPLIDQKKVVPNTYRLKDQQRVLMITGPNMGGKTVTLKTMGLFVSLIHAGFPVSAHRCVIPYYNSLWFDIGDQQSIENNLSTFSSHVSTLSKICSNSDEDSFVLLDEVGNGTDPLEGSCLAIAILDHLIEKGCTIITSTHYNQVKAYGKTNEHILVSSMQFDSETLKPTYRYVPGVSGASYAFSIARQYHLKDSIIEHASMLKKENEQESARELERLEQLQNDVLKEKERFANLIQEAHAMQREADENKRKWQEKKERLDKEYVQKLNAMLEEKEQEMKALIETFKDKKVVQLHEQAEALHQLRSMEVQIEAKETKEEFKIGDYVQIKGLNSHGEILELRKKEALVLANGMKMKVKVNNLTKINRPKIEKFQPKVHQDKVFTRVPMELNIIGYRVEEGLRALDHYLDQCVAHNMKQVRIIHGMGTGKLRSAVMQDLKKHPNVKQVMAAGPSDGGLGATIVTLK